MDENTQYLITLADKTKIEAASDGAGNFIISSEYTKSLFSSENISEVKIEYSGRTDTLKKQVLRTYYDYGIGQVLIRFSDMTDYERLEEVNNMLEECILEMSEIIYA